MRGEQACLTNPQDINLIATMLIMINPTLALASLAASVIITNKIILITNQMTIILISIIITTLALASLAASASAAIALWSWIGRRASLLQIIRMIIRLKMIGMMYTKKVTIDIQKVSSQI